MLALTIGCAFSASVAARARHGRKLRLVPSRASNSSLTRARSRATLVRSTSTTVVSCAETWSDSTMRAAITLRSRLIFSRVPRFGETAPEAADALAAGAAGAAAAGAGCSGAGDGAEVDAVLRGELAHERGHVGGGVVARRRHGRCCCRRLRRLGGLLGRRALGVGRLAGRSGSRLLSLCLRGRRLGGLGRTSRCGRFGAGGLGSLLRLRL